MDADLLIVMGTSLTVHPFASLINMVKGKCPRVLINLDAVGGVGSSLNDLVFLGKCDDIIRDLGKELGWEEELDREWMKTATSLDTHEAAPSTPPKAKDQTDGTKLDLEIEKIIERVEDSLVVSKKDKAGVEEANLSTRPSGSASEDVRDKDSVTSPPETPQKGEDEGSKSPKQDKEGGERRS
jgi:NAD+-dependent protein deacetylase SIR2